MVPLSFHDFYTGCATIAGALIGLLFVALSVSSEYLSGANARTDHQVRAGAADNGPHHPGGDQPGSAGTSPEQDPGTGRAPA